MVAAPSTAPTATTSLPAYMVKRADYLLAFTEADHDLSLFEVRPAAKKACLGNPGSATRHGYVKKTGSGEHTRAITGKGKKWLEDNGFAPKAP